MPTRMTEKTKNENMIMPSTDDYAEQVELSFMTDRNTKWYSPPERSLAVSYEIKHAFTIRPSNPTPGYLPYSNVNLGSHKNLE